ncbi:acyltransferase family protein [Streptomyces sp. NPDC053048]|uniref:acyltransferase family protein n=1 Tax=Streptomyces sp. NPDC053048 TaxID=3365694 RepID=UPI0037CE5342
MGERVSLRDVGGGNAARIPTFEGLRGILAFGVVVYHVAFQSGVSSFIDQPGKGIWGTLADGLGVCLPPFFVLSGLMLYRPFARATLVGTRKPEVRPFLWRRALRILPAYWLLIAFTMPAFNSDALNSPWDVLRPLLMIHFFWNTGQPMHGIDPTWTVPTEFAFYLALPVLAWIAHRWARSTEDPLRRMRRMLAPLLVLELFSIGWIVYTNLPSTGQTTLWYWPPYYVGYFAGGMLLAILSAYAEISPRTPAVHRWMGAHPMLFWLAGLGIYALYAAKLIGISGMGNMAALWQEVFDHFLVAAFALLIVGPMTVPGVKSRLMDGLLANKPVRYLGQVSFGVYLWHEIVINVYLENGSIFGSPALPTPEFRGSVGFWELLAFTLPVSVAIATASYYLLERPVARWGKRWGPGSRRTAPAAPAPVPGDRPTATDPAKETAP